MTSLFGGSAAKPTRTPEEMTARLEQLKSSIANQLALQNAQEIMTKVTQKCFTKCITKPGTSLSGSDEKCLSMCMERYLEAFDIVNKAYITRLRKERLDQQSL
ncbi:Tim10/DDP family zinc finger-domain-containing protein [Trametes gibbosa]|nr:Tim10/DDP family zinc finger-domain-containing protein [Trametes gibbosa]